MSSLKKNEQAPLLETTSSVDNNQKSNSSKLRETGIIITLLTVQFLMTSVDYMPVPFLPYEGGLRGLTEIQIGVIVGSYELAKTLTAPFCDRMVSSSCITTEQFSIFRFSFRFSRYFDRP